MRLDDFLGQLNRFRNKPGPNGFCDVQTNSTQGVPTGIDDNGATVTPPSPRGVTGPATGNKPGVGSPAANSKAGGSPVPAQFAYVVVDYCVGGVTKTAHLIGLTV